jgi:hypothetical protein
MKKIVLVYGLIAGTITGGLMMATMPLFENNTLDKNNGELIGYTGMVIALSLIFFGIKSYRDNQPSRSITFWKGCQIGLLIALIASVMYALAWEITFRNTGPAFMESMMEHYYAEMKADGATEDEISEQKDMMQAYYNNALMRFGVSLTEIFPVGLIITLICAAALRQKNFLPATNTTPS